MHTKKMPTTTIHPEKAYTEIPHMVLCELDLNDLPIERKKAFITTVQSQIDDRLKNLLLEGLTEDESLAEIENVLIADEDVDSEELVTHLIHAMPNFSERWEKSCEELYQSLIQK
jgi:hypothetical protein